MKRISVFAGAVLLATTTAAFASSGQIASLCCAIGAACCGLGLPCCG